MVRRKRGQSNEATSLSQGLVKKGPSSCPNCKAGLPTGSQFCHHCGQEQKNLHIGFLELLKEFIVNNFNFDTRLLKTLKLLLFKPGFLTQEFSLGRRASYVPPIRLYLFISFVYFLVLGLNLDEKFQTDPDIQIEPESSLTESDSVQHATSDTGHIALKGINKNNATELDLMIENGELKNSPVLAHFVSQVSRLLNAPDEHKSELKRLFNKSLSVSMFILMPVFALLLWLIWGQPRPFYIDTLIFSIHAHSFAFLLLTLKNLASPITLSSWLDLLTFILFFIYLVIGLKHMKDISFWRALRRSIFIQVIYSLFVGVTLVAIGLVSIWLI